MTIKHGLVGAKDPQQGSYVLVDVENRTSQERSVAVEGILKDQDGNGLGPLAVEELRIPAGGRRAFALVATAPTPTAKAASFRIRRAEPAEHGLPVVIANAETIREDGKLVARIRIKNTLPKGALASIMATFYDKNGKVLARPWIAMSLDSSSTRPFRFDGPKEAETAEAFVGEVLY
ncbi:MAG: hypothetical protein V2A73_18695 [Pseudomonadota bacterium]